MEAKPIDLYEFLVESELQHYYNTIKNELKITTAAQLKYATDEDLRQLGLSRPEIRRMRKFYEKHFPHGYFSKIKRLLQNPKREELNALNQSISSDVIKTSNSPTKLSNNKHIIPADTICVNKQLGSGEFGIVQQGVWTNGTERIQVAIKCLCRERMQSNPMEFLKEAAIMHGIENENIVRLYGVVLDTESLMLVTELAPLRSLLECLKDSGLRVSFLTVSTLCEFAMQICNGMMYLESKRLIHRDLAARNILVFSKNKVKISDFGLSRALGVGKDYYQTNFNVNLKLPIAWCAPECINFLRFTNSSDIWAYAVCLWEIFSYGFQPWAALTGHQILEAIDEPNYHRLEQPDCCPREYYALMLKCWQHDPLKRPKFTDIYVLMPEMKPEQLKTVVSCTDVKKDHLMYRQGDIITVLDKLTNSHFWKGVLNSGKTGLFNPANTVAHLDSLPSSMNKDAFTRTTLERSSKRKLKTEMISRPQNDLKHTGHVGLDGAYFGDVSFLASQNYNKLPRQVVTPYKPSEDLETPLLPLLPPTPTSPDSTQTASGYFPSEAAANQSFINIENNVNLINSVGYNGSSANFGSTFDFQTIASQQQQHVNLFSDSNPFTNSENNDSIHGADHQLVSIMNLGANSSLYGDEHHQDNGNIQNWPKIVSNNQDAHEYHEISDDDENPAEKEFDLGPSLMDEMDSMFRSMTANSDIASLSQDFDRANKKNENTENASKLNRKNSSNQSGSSNSTGASGTSKSKKKNSTVKPISVKDEKILNHAIEITTDACVRSMTDIETNNTQIQSPKRKFSFRFPNLSHNCDKDMVGLPSNFSNTNTQTNNIYKERRNFSEDLKNVPDLQHTITEEHRLAYNSLVENPTSTLSRLDFMKTKYDMGDTKQLSTTLPRKLSESTLSLRKTEDTDLSLPKTHTARLSLAKKKSDSSLNEQDSGNPLRQLRNGNFPIVRPRVKTLPTLDHNESINSMTGLLDSDKDSMCESPSYLVVPEYTFSTENNLNLLSEKSKGSANKDVDKKNPIPLPPRDRTKQMATNVKRHIRKHPLIIPGTGLQRTLNKVTQATPPEMGEASNFAESLRSFDDSPSNYNIDSAAKKNIEKLKLDRDDINVERFNVGKHYAKDFIVNNFPFNHHEHTNNSERTYENMNVFHSHFHDNIDTASLHFESILENDVNKVGEMLASSPDVVDGFILFDIKKTEVAPVEAVAKELDQSPVVEVEKTKKKKSQKFQTPKNELASNSLFNKIKETVEIAELNKAKDASEKAIEQLRSSVVDSSSSSISKCDIETECELKKSINNVSCEDLLEFSEKKPKGRERGLESDEVRIMYKVLSKKIIPERCLETLDNPRIDWDVHKAIKICRLQNILKSANLTLDECVEALELYEWDLQTTVLKLKLH